MVNDEISDEWSQLHGCLLDLISEKLISDDDFIRFGSVCTCWRSVFLDNIDRRYQTYRHQLPMLIIPLVDHQKENNDQQTIMNKRSLYSLNQQSVIHNFQISMPDNRSIFGSSFGWLVTVAITEDQKYPVTLLNPFLPINHEIELPSLHSLPPGSMVHGTTLEKAVVSANPALSVTDYVVMAIYGGFNRLAFWKPGDKNWTSVDTEKDALCEPGDKNWTSVYTEKDALSEPGYDIMDTLYVDIIYHNDQFYALRIDLELMACDIHNDHPKLRHFAPPPPDIDTDGTDAKYVVESLGDLFLVHRDRKHDVRETYTTCGFQVFKLLLDHDVDDVGKWTERRWIEVKTLDGHAFFIGNNASFSISALDFPGCKPNCIYFTDDYLNDEPTPNLSRGPHEMAIFSLKDQSFTHHYNESESNSSFLWPNPIWVETTICKTTSDKSNQIKSNRSKTRSYFVNLSNQFVRQQFQFLRCLIWPEGRLETRPEGCLL